MASTQIAPLMRCTKCDTEFPWTIEFFSKSSTYKGKIYLLKKCRECIKAYDRQRWVEQPERRNNHAVSVRKSQTEFREEYRARHKAWRDANPEKVRALWQRNYKKNGASHLAKNAQWRADNPDLCNVYRRNRRALESAGGGHVSASEFRSIAEKQAGKCFYCRTADIQEFDHFIPLIRGGIHEATNLRGSCLPCNRSKSVKMPWEWKPERFPPP